MLMLFLEQARGRPTWSLRATWRPRAPRLWPLVYRLNSDNVSDWPLPNKFLAAPLSSVSRNHLTTFCRPFAHYACDFFQRWFTFSKTVVFSLSAMADERKCWSLWLLSVFAGQKKTVQGLAGRTRL